MQIGVVKESVANESRVAASPSSISQLIKLNFSVTVESGAGDKASFSDSMYEEAGAIVSSAESAWQSDILLKVNPPSDGEVEKMKEGATLIGFFWPAQNEELMKKLANRKINVLAMDSVPRISRAQSMDALSSMANIAGYRAVVEASHCFGSFFTGQITAAGKVPPAKVLIIGAGVAGLAAIGTAGSLGAIVRAFDTRPEVKEQIESMGAEFLELDFEEEAGSGDGYAKVMSKEFIEAEMALFAEQAKDVDIIITTAMIPGKPAPKLITEDMVRSMKRGSVIVDLAALGGGNCELTEEGKAVEVDGVTIIGYSDMPARLPTQSSQLYANNLLNLLKLLTPQKNGQIELNFDDEVIRNVTVTKQGEITWPPPPVKVSAAPAPKKEAPTPVAKKEEKSASGMGKSITMLIGASFYVWLASVAPPDFMQHFTVFILACIIGYYVVWNVTHALHTPLMSVTNAISGIIVVGAILQISSTTPLVMWIAVFAVLIAFINVVGGFVVTKRMLKMFRKED
ncbi:Re/Si-specific NAD(P)(+) transhydrogenase subunit alpha [Aliikangiella sp. G2MR2-5]|uniref:Re/Si-specific NAD(P)(+) transhydrogenase subunit alpha n=1 Tax=Aliikangiella sp. G2MR2-5 TaxID=2788943 RepID=UPI0018ABFE2D|nr:Re/Si-specific NAD(P)(+) transhydrogenase subunit alpha [Aliikangiella sp. G2MR2-5]